MKYTAFSLLNNHFNGRHLSRAQTSAFLHLHESYFIGQTGSFLLSFFVLIDTYIYILKTLLPINHPEFVKPLILFLEASPLLQIFHVKFISLFHQVDFLLTGPLHILQSFVDHVLLPHDIISQLFYIFFLVLGDDFGHILLFATSLNRCFLFFFFDLLFVTSNLLLLFC